MENTEIEKKENCAYLATILMTGVILGFITGIVTISLFYPIFQSDQWAAWVQAIGSIGAILGAIYIMKKSDNLRKANEKNIERRKFKHHIEILRHSAKVASNTLTELNNKYYEIHSYDQKYLIQYYGSYEQYKRKTTQIPIDILLNTFDIPLWALRKIDIHTHPYIFLSISTGQIIQYMENTKHHFKTPSYSSGFIDKNNIDNLMNYLKKIKKDCDEELSNANNIYDEINL